MKIVVLDTNALVRDWHFKAPSLSSLFDLGRRSELRIVVPEVVVLELVNKYREEVLSVDEDLKKSGAQLDRLGLVSQLPKIGANEAAQRYEGWLREHLSAARVQVAAIPDIPHLELLVRVLQRRRPFSAGDKGYRDALIWESVLSLGDRPSIHLISADNAFYVSNDSGILHPDLMSVQRTNRVSGHRSVGTFLDGHLSQNNEALRDVRDALGDGVFGRSVADRVAAAALEAGLLETDARGDALYDFDLFELPDGGDSPSVERAEVQGEVEVESARSVGEDSYLLDLKADVELAISFYAHKSDAYAWQGAARAYIVDPDWNEHMVLCELTTQRDIYFEARWTRGDADVQDIQITGI
jgi:hypothetical protein